ncbi:hypothetical protein HDU76_002849, partial [Blyttiomyces sp. JEL0837]
MIASSTEAGSSQSKQSSSHAVFVGTVEDTGDGYEELHAHDDVNSKQFRYKHTKSSLRAMSAPVNRTKSAATTSSDEKSKEGPRSKLPPPAPGNAHKRYSSVYPSANRLLAKRWDDAARDRHRRKLATMKSYIDNTPPKRHGHLQLRLKKMQLEEEKIGKIERDNLILLDRMARQMSEPQGFSGLDNEYRLKPYNLKPTPNSRKKKELLQQIEEENQILMQRVEAREPHYRQDIWDDERRTNLSYLQRISRFPEGYQHVLEREGVPPPLKGPLKIKMNRSELLRKSWFHAQSEEIHDDIHAHQRKTPSKPNSDNEDSETEEKPVE